ncbi:hypothetical protein ASA1KI_20530 [Opitutales bacterium ASA1]|uniref:AtzH-like domain-containing protein n=1 Tax=Congregicoccus parvus TaxID=3081749 RepID=UPI002B2FA77C|nr:hypothetical protein ASA1KI_20530 [Opitutales bacterium ASA1]
MFEINRPDVVAEVTACCDAYERALVANEVARLREFFWDSPHTIRFGATEQLYGAEEIAAFRQARVVDFSGRRVLRSSVLALGGDVAVAMLEFETTIAGRVRHGRQTQVWARIPEVGWRVTSAHVSRLTVSEMVEDYADAAASLVLAPLAPEHRPGVVQALGTAAALAAPLLAFELPADIEVAPVFTP